MKLKQTIVFAAQQQKKVNMSYTINKDRIASRGEGLTMNWLDAAIGLYTVMLHTEAVNRLKILLIIPLLEI